MRDSLIGKDINTCSPATRCSSSACPRTGSVPSAATFSARCFCALADRVFARSVSAVPPRLHIYLDEYQRFATSTTAELLTQGRKYGAGITLAHQDLHRIRDIRIRNSSRRGKSGQREAGPVGKRLTADGTSAPGRSR